MANLTEEGVLGERFSDMVAVGEGGFATVYRALDVRLSRQVAIKIFKDSAEVDRELFEREITALGRMSGHPNVVAVFDADYTSEGRPFIIMEYLPRGTLLDLVMTEGPLGEDEVLRLLPPLIEALRSAHSSGLVHGDVKPSNIFLSAFGEPVLGDFGIATLLSRRRPSNDERRYHAFSLAVAPPEVISDKPVAPTRDIYALGATVFILLTGSSPYPAKPAEKHSDFFSRIADLPVPSLPATIDTDLRSVVEAMLAKNPDERPSLDWILGRILELRALRGMPAAQAGLSSGPDGQPGSRPVPPHAEPDSVEPVDLVSPEGPTTLVPPLTTRPTKNPKVGQSPQVRLAPDTNGNASWDGPPAPAQADHGKTTSRADLSGSLSAEGRVESADGPIAVHAAADRPTVTDLLGRTPMVVGLARAVDDLSTDLPITVGILGRWGVGKSSLMLQLADVLASPVALQRRWLPVHIGLWRYGGSERVWAVLTKQIRRQVLSHVGGFWLRTSFRAQVAVQRRGLVRSALPVVVGVVGALLVVLAVVAALGNTFTALSPWVVAAAGTAALGASTFAEYMQLVGASAVQRLRSKDSKYEEFLGLPEQAFLDLDALLKVLSKRDLHVAIFLDDLDRCAPSRVLETVTTLSEIVAGRERWPAAFFIGFDHDLVVASLEASYADTLTALRLRSDEKAKTYGNQYLEKIVQMSVRIDENRTSIPAVITAPGSGRPSVDQAGRVETYVEMLRRSEPVELEDLIQARRADIPATENLDTENVWALREAMRLERARILSTAAPSVHEAEAQVLRVLQLTPRGAKRFDNAFRLQLHVANCTPTCQLLFTRGEILALAKWVALSVTWPQIVRILDDEIGLLNQLELVAAGPTRHARLAQQFREGPLEDALTPRDVRSLADLLYLGDGGPRITELPMDSFRRIT